MFSESEHYIIVNYHYVRNPDSRSAGIFPCAVGEFRRQIEFLSKRYHIVSIREVWEAAQREEKGSYCALTFDDGLKDHYENAFPILKKYGATATFFIIGCVFDGALPAAHALHILMSFFPVPALAAIFKEFLKTHHPLAQDKYPIPSDVRLTPKRMHEDILTANFKETIMRIPSEIKAGFIEVALSSVKKETRDITTMLFMKEEEIKELQKSGMQIGSHSYLHIPFCEKPEEELCDDLRHAGKMLSHMFGELSPVFSYPHGRADERGISAIKKEGFRYAVTIERRGVKKGDNPFLIPRYDTADIVV